MSKQTAVEDHFLNYLRPVDSDCVGSPASDLFGAILAYPREYLISGLTTAQTSKPKNSANETSYVCNFET